MLRLSSLLLFLQQLSLFTHKCSSFHSLFTNHSSFIADSPLKSSDVQGATQITSQSLFFISSLKNELLKKTTATCHTFTLQKQWKSLYSQTFSLHHSTSSSPQIILLQKFTNDIPSFTWFSIKLLRSSNILFCSHSKFTA